MQSPTELEQPSLDPALEQACTDYWQYLRAILEPAMAELQADIDAKRASLHRVFGANLFVAHAVDYIRAIRKADGSKESRFDFIRRFDQLFCVEGILLAFQRHKGLLARLWFGLREAAKV